METKFKFNKNFVVAVTLSVLAICFIPGIYFLSVWIYTIVPFSATDLIDIYLPYVLPGLIVSWTFYILFVWLSLFIKEQYIFKNEKINKFAPIVRKIALVISYLAAFALPVVFLVCSVVSDLSKGSSISNTILFFVFSLIAYLLVLVVPKVYKSKTDKSLPHIVLLFLYNLITALYLLSLVGVVMILVFIVGVIFIVVVLWVLSHIRIRV